MTRLLPDSDEGFAKQMIDIRKHLKLTYLGFAEKCKVSTFTIYKIETVLMPRLTPCTWNKINDYLVNSGYFQQGDNSDSETV